MRGLSPAGHFPLRAGRLFSEPRFACFGPARSDSPPHVSRVVWLRRMKYIFHRRAVKREIYLSGKILRNRRNGCRPDTARRKGLPLLDSSGTPLAKAGMMAKSKRNQWKPTSIVEVADERLKLTEWAGRLGCPVQTIIDRLDRKWPPAKAVTDPIGESGGANRGLKMAVEVLTVDEVERLMAACNNGTTGQRNRALIVLGWRAGLRCSEALALRPKDIDQQAATVRVLHGKGDKARTVGLDQQAWSVVTTWIEKRSALTLPADAPLICTLDGGELDSRYVRELMPRLAKDAGIAKRVHFHGLRHTMASELAAEGVAVHLIQQQLGHSNLAVTSRYISSLNPADTINAMKGRTWSGQPAKISPTTTTAPPPDWLSRLRNDIGDRLFFFSDARSNQTSFRAIVLLVD